MTSTPWQQPDEPAAPFGALLVPLALVACLLLRAGLELVDVTRPKCEPRPPGPIELNETRVTRHELP